MPRRKRNLKKNLKPDTKYNSLTIAKFVNHIMRSGKKTKAKNILYTAMTEMQSKLKDQNMSDTELLEKALANVKPSVEVRSRRVGGATYQVPVEVSPTRSLKLAIKWIMAGADSQSGKSMSEKLSKELIDAFKGMGSAIKIKVDRYKMAEANRAFAGFRWN